MNRTPVRLLITAAVCLAVQTSVFAADPAPVAPSHAHVLAAIIAQHKEIPNVPTAKPPAHGSGPRTPDPGSPVSAMAELEGVLSRSSEGLTLITHRDGMASVDLEGRFQHAFLVRIDTDGELISRCMSNAHAARSFLALSDTENTAAGVK